METYQHINMFFKLIYSTYTNIIRELLSDYDTFTMYQTWFNKHAIELPSLKRINENTFKLIDTIKDIDQLDAILHMSLKDDINKFKSTYQDKIYYICIGKDYPIPHPHYTVILEDEVYDDPFPGFIYAFIHKYQWPGILTIHQNNYEFISETNRDISYYLHLSDLHLGPSKNNKNLESLYTSLNIITPMLDSSHQLKTVITGDLMNSPNRKNMYKANDFMTSLKKYYHTDVTFILGNHDVIVLGLNLRNNQKSKVIAYLLGEKLKIIPDDKVIFIKIDSTSHGNLARGMIGKRQLLEIDAELDTIENIEDYTLIALLHHHVYPIQKAEFLKTGIKDNTIVGKVLDETKVLLDAPMFITWLKKHNIKYVLHGHKHIPTYIHTDDFDIISAGSATGGLKEDKNHYLSYNLITYDYKYKQMISCIIFYIDHQKERIRVEIHDMGGHHETR